MAFAARTWPWHVGCPPRERENDFLAPTECNSVF